MRTSPFPGMDPYLEDAAEWGGVHTRLINSISDQLAEQVSPHFSVKIEKHVYITTPGDPYRQPIVPDIYIVKTTPSLSGLTATAGIAPPTLVEPVYSPEVRERYIEIIDKRSREVVTTIEVLSPFNKTKNTPGREMFVQKRQKVMATDVHWVEIDLLRSGERPAEVAGKSDYYALLKRGGALGPFEVWYFDLRDGMPTIAIPLRSPFADAPLNLQAAFADTYKRGHYGDDIDYADSPPPPTLRPADALWVKTQIAAWHKKQL